MASARAMLLCVGDKYRGALVGTEAACLNNRSIVRLGEATRPLATRLGGGALLGEAGRGLAPLVTA